MHGRARADKTQWFYTEEAKKKSSSCKHLEDLADCFHQTNEVYFLPAFFQIEFVFCRSYSLVFCFCVCTGRVHLFILNSARNSFGSSTGTVMESVVENYKIVKRDSVA
jgi:hypothetical protein